MRAMMSMVLGVALLCPMVARADDKGGKKVAGVLNFKMKSIDGKEVDLSKYEGKVVMFVNVASKCGYTPQYKELQAIYEKYSKEGFVVVGVPANEFGKQEPGADDEIAKFCDSKYGVKFDLLSKVVVKGKDMCPLYQYLTSKETDPKFAGDIKWNFTKFVVGKNGEIVGRFEPGVKPDAKEVIDLIETELKK